MKIKDICELKVGHSIAKELFFNDGVKYLRTKDLKNNGVFIVDTENCVDISQKDTRVFEKDRTIGICNVGIQLGKMAILGEDMAISQVFTALIVKDGFSVTKVFEALSRIDFSKYMSGSTMQKIKRSDLGEIELEVSEIELAEIKQELGEEASSQCWGIAMKFED